jgi:DNA-directed RNA polymerase subunit RPC12/RpoP
MSLGDPLIDGAFGITRCPNAECSMSWVFIHVPEYCPRCGAKVTDKPAPDRTEVSNFIRKHNIDIIVSVCSNCGYHVLGDTSSMDRMCPLCRARLNVIHPRRTGRTPGFFQKIISLLRA